jgi:hypothetical protein
MQGLRDNRCNYKSLYAEDLAETDGFFDSKNVCRQPMQYCTKLSVLILLSLCNTFNRYQYPTRKRHDLRGTSCRCIVRKELFVDLVYYCEVISCHHKYCRLYNLGYIRPGVLEDRSDVRKALSYLLFKIRTDDLPGSRVDPGSSGYKNKIAGYNGMRENVAHSWRS